MSKHKTIQLKTTIGKNDLARKMLQARKFLEKGSSVKISLYLYGRQKAKPEIGVEFLEEVHKEFLPDYKISGKVTPKNLSLFFNAPPRKKE